MTDTNTEVNASMNTYTVPQLRLMHELSKVGENFKAYGLDHMLLCINIDGKTYDVSLSIKERKQ